MLTLNRRRGLAGCIPSRVLTAREQLVPSVLLLAFLPLKGSLKIYLEIRFKKRFGGFLHLSPAVQFILRGKRLVIY